MGIVRVEHQKNYTSIDNRTINDDQLSWDTLGLLTWFLSKPPNWQVRVGFLTTIRKAGKDKLGRMLKELSDAGYLERRKIRDEHGAFSIESIVRERPFNQSGKSAVVGKSADQSGLAGAGEPAPVNPPLIKTDLINTDQQTNNGFLGNPFAVKPKYPAGKFEEFWSLYTKKVGKKAAQRAWLKVPAGEFGKLMARLKTFIAVDWLGKELAHIPDPATWLNQERWNDAIVPPARNGNGHHPTPEPDTPLYHQPFDRKKYDYENQQ